MEADQDGDGKLSFDEFAQTVANTVCLILCPLQLVLCPGSLPRYARVHRAFAHPLLRSCILTFLLFSGYCKTNDARRLILDGADAHAAYPSQPATLTIT